MIANDMLLKINRGKQKVQNAIAEWNGCTLLSTGITGDDARMAKAAVDGGVRMLEPNHPALALARGYKGVTTMHDAEKIRHEITVAQMAEAVRGVRCVVGDDVYITCGIAGGFTELVPTLLREEDYLCMSNAGADGLHIHKSSMKDLLQVVELAHHYGLLVDAYIGKSTDRHIFGLAADTAKDVERIAKDMVGIGVDMVGLMTGMSYDGVESGKIHPEIEERLCALVGAANVPTLAEGGINTENSAAFKKTGVNILVVGTSFDQMAQQAIKDAINLFR